MKILIYHKLFSYSMATCGICAFFSLCHGEYLFAQQLTMALFPYTQMRLYSSLVQQIDHEINHSNQGIVRVRESATNTYTTKMQMKHISQIKNI